MLVCAPAFCIPLLSIFGFHVEVFHTLSGRRRNSFHRTGPGSLAAFLTLPSKLFNDGLTAFFGRFSLINVFFRNVYLPKTFFGAWPFLMADLTCSHRPPGRCVFSSCFSISSSHIHDGMRGAKGGIGRCRTLPQAQKRPGETKKPIPQSETVRLPAKAGSYQKIFEKYKTAQKANSNFVHSFCVKMI